MEVGWDNVLGFIHIFTNVTQCKEVNFKHSQMGIILGVKTNV